MATVEIPAMLYRQLQSLAKRQRLSVDEFVIKMVQFKLDHHEKTMLGLAAARLNGVKIGPQARLSPEQVEEVKLRRWNGEKIAEIHKHFPQISRTRLTFLINHT